MQDNHRHFIRRDGDSGDNASAGFLNGILTENVNWVVINRYQNIPMNIDTRTIDSEKLQHKLHAINEHIREHNEQVEGQAVQWHTEFYRER